MVSYLVVALSVGALCAAWALVQRFIAQRDPEVRGPESSAGGCCGACGTCDKADSHAG
jgi:hypothetical protein